MMQTRRILFLICGDEEKGREDARARGCTQIAALRFAHPDNHDLYVVRRFGDLMPGTPLNFIKGKDFEDNEEKERFEQFVESGHGVWVDG